MLNIKTLKKLKAGDKVAILTLSWGAPALFPGVFELGLSRLRAVFQLEPVELKTTRMLDATVEEKTADLIAAFRNPDIKAVIASIGGDCQVEYVKNLPTEPFRENPKIFLGYSDNSNFCNFLWHLGIPSYYGGNIMTQFGMNIKMDELTVEFLRHVFFDTGEFALYPAVEFNEIGLDWAVEENLYKSRAYLPNKEGWIWDGQTDAEGITWGGCLESIGDMLLNQIEIPTLEQFGNIVLISETCEEVPPHHAVRRIFRALGERGILSRCRGFLIGRAKAGEFDKQYDQQVRDSYRKEQYEATLTTIRKYNKHSPIVLNVDFGHTDPQIAIPYGQKARIAGSSQQIFLTY